MENDIWKIALFGLLNDDEQTLWLETDRQECLSYTRQCPIGLIVWPDGARKPESSGFKLSSEAVLTFTVILLEATVLDSSLASSPEY